MAAHEGSPAWIASVWTTHVRRVPAPTINSVVADSAWTPVHMFRVPMVNLVWMGCVRRIHVEAFRALKVTNVEPGCAKQIHAMG